MMVFSMRCCRRGDLFRMVAALWLLIALPLAARAEGIEVKQARLAMAEDGYYLEADFDVALNATLEDVLKKGVALHFVQEFELIRPRWYWFNETIANSEHHYRLSFHPLTRQYRVGIGALSSNFNTLAEALYFISRVRSRPVAEAGVLKRDTAYTAALRMRLDVSRLPKPFQISAFGSREWNIGSDWYRWTVTP
ncbi:MAG: DUF4390 domain-containing protein [Betaproteobacteria bacterium]|nr:DUF4390 domain-containing protein [Betaproteobacteria bacterium]